ncbi:MAG: sigma-54 interaction domain-containing protein, partial [Desulfitobacteriaceae bacterium]
MITNNIMDSIHDGVIVVSMDSTILYANPAYTRCFGVQVGKVLGRKLSEIEPNSRVLAVLRTGKPVVDDHSHVVSVGIDIVANITPVFELGKMTGAVAVFRDATEVMALKDLVTRYHSELLELRTRLLDVEDVVWDSQAMRRVSELAQRVAMVDSTVLISGESGTGKEVVAKLIHRLSQRHEGPMVAINCGAIPENLLESELFGYEKGAFTGAVREGKAGLLEVADKGTILLDEIGELPLSLQVKLLRVIQELRFMRIGGVKQVKVDVRFVAATNRDLKIMVKQGTFREDLFYRLNVVPIHIPPLRERKRDIAGLIRV